MTNQFPGATKMVLSPAAQAILAAAQKYEINPECYSRQIATAALRVAADQVDWNWEPCSQLLAIADELEAQ
jgi:hypothetical protein